MQIAGEELDLDMNQLSAVRLDTNVTPDQGATSSSSSIERGGPQVRAAAAEARLALLQRASTRLGVQIGSLLGGGTGNVVCAAGPLPSNVTITFGGALAAHAQAVIGIAANNLTGPDPQIAHTTTGVGINSRGAYHKMRRRFIVIDPERARPCSPTSERGLLVIAALP